MTPTVSILLPAYNAETWVVEAVESALVQGPNVEVIVIDDGSSDGTVDMLRRFDGRIHWETGPNRGAPVARNRALSLARGAWVQYLDADDYLEPGKVSAQLAALQDMGDIDVIYGPETIEWHGDSTGDGNGAPTRSWSPLPEPHDPYALLALWKLPQTGGPLWRRQALLDVGGWREDQPCCQEHELYLRLLMAGKRFAYHPASQGAIYRRFDTGTLSTRNPAKVRAERAKIEARLEAHLSKSGHLTPERHWAINQARFEMARASWSEDRSEARRHHEAITGRGFVPRGVAAPRSYRMVYRLLGFEVAERIANLRRGLHVV
ncbi:glycosyltransferase [uncultured Pelagimonas sp.]|uniref:glycosyltransferase family 2 protein n=1 Tax=uncultured Pelagimonas sp. TaxID=1618102 RepID=UPI00260A4B76|nr:glycosyltransferase [uncultured Pelagimonas sp.]